MNGLSAAILVCFKWIVFCTNIYGIYIRNVDSCLIGGL